MDVRTQAAASRTQAEATLEQVRIARRLAALEVSLTLADRAFGVRRVLVEEPTVVDAVNRRRELTSVRRPILTMLKRDKLTILIENCLLNSGQSSTPVRTVLDTETEPLISRRPRASGRRSI